MRVSSPIGDLPFEPTALRLQDGRLQMDGLMGAWPAQVTFDISDLPSIGRVIARPALFGAGIALTALGVAKLSRSTNRTTRKGNPA